MRADEPELDLHGMRVAEAVRRASVFLVQEQRRGTISVRIITGRGTGALKSAITELLRSHPAVASTSFSLHTDAVVLVKLNPPRRA